MQDPVNPADLVADATANEVADQICPKCEALIVMDTFTGKPICNCTLEEDMAKEVAAAQQNRKQAAQPARKAPVKAPQAAGAKPVAQEVPEEPEAKDAAPQGAMPVFSAKDALFAMPGAPSQAQIDVWKGEYGSVYIFPFDTKEIYVWRPMRRREWQMLQSNEALVKEEAKFQEQVVMRSVLWPKIGPVELNLSRAGLVQTLFNVIMQGSYFLHPDFAVSLVEEL